MRRPAHLRSYLGVLALSAAAGLGAASSSAQQTRCVSPPHVQRPGTFAAGAADSPALPGRVFARLAGRFPCPDGAEWWFEYGPTAAYGERTASNDASVPINNGTGYVVVRTDVDGLDYGDTHYRIVVRYPDGAIETGGDQVLTARPGALRPPAQVTFHYSRDPTPARTILDDITVLGAPPGSVVSLACYGDDRCRPDEQKLAVGSRAVVFRSWTIRRPGYLAVGVGGKGTGIATFIRPRLRRPPTLESVCSGGAVRMETKCVTVSLDSVSRRRFGRVAIADAARGSHVIVSCNGPGCPRSDLSFFVDTPIDDPYADFSWRRFNRVRRGAVLRVFITRARTYGVTRTFRLTRRGVIRGGYGCLRPGGLRRVTCPTVTTITVGRG